MRRPLERRPAGEGLVEDRPEGVDVGRRADRVALGLLGGHVAGCPHHLAADGRPVRDLEPLRQAEVGDLRRAVGVEEDVGRLQVAVDDPDVVDRADAAGEAGHELGGLPGRHRRPVEALGERAAVEHLEREIREGSRRPSRPRRSGRCWDAGAALRLGLERGTGQYCSTSTPETSPRIILRATAHRLSWLLDGLV